MNGEPTTKGRFGTLAVRAGIPHDDSIGAVTEQICLSTTFQQSIVGQPVGPYTYSRSSNPNRQSLEKAIAALEDGKHALVFSSGLAATSTLLLGLASQSHVVCMASLYGGTHRYLTRVGTRHGVSVSFAHNMETEIEGLIRDDTRLVWIESPSNPTLDVVDIAAISEIAHRRGALVVVDNTFLSPYIQKPLELGADIVVHSVTKWMNGHSDVLMGAVTFNADEIMTELAFLQNAIGSVPSPFDCWLAHRGLRTLHIRVKTASETALSLAIALERSPHVLSVAYPGLDSHPQRSVAVKQHRGGMGGGVVSFRIRGGGDAAARFCELTKYFTLGESLGSVESLCEVPALMTHTAIPAAEMEALGIYPDLIRLSIGLEDREDLMKDVLETLEKASKST